MNSRQNFIDLSAGLFMLLGIVAFAVLAIKVCGINAIATKAKGYHVVAEFSDIGSLKVRAPVTLAGVKIGEVTKIELDAGDWYAKVTMHLNQKPLIPAADVSARILTQGLLGANYISIIPGFDESEAETIKSVSEGAALSLAMAESKKEGSQRGDSYLKEGDIIARTQEAIILENLIGQLLFNIKK